MSRPPPPKHYVSSMSEDDNNNDDPQQQQQQQQQGQYNNMPPPPPPPPPPPALENRNNNSPPLQQPPPSLILPPQSVLRISSNNNSNKISKNSVAFSNVMDNLNIANSNSNDPPPPPNNNNDTNNMLSNAAATAASNAIFTPSEQHHHLHPKKMKKKKTSSSSVLLTLDNVIQSQFENEAETHILAALEMEELDNNANGNNHNNAISSLASTTIGGGNNNNDVGSNNNNRMIDSYLLGESLEEGMEDYSEDEDDEEQQEQPPNNNRDRTWSNDSFLRKFKEQSHELPQYQIGLYPTTSSGDRSPSQTSSRSSSVSPQAVRRRKGSIGNQSSQSQQQQQQQHRRFLSNRVSSTSSSGGVLLQSVPDDSSLEYDIDNTGDNLAANQAKSLAMHIESEHSKMNDRSDNPFLEGIKNVAVNAADKVAAKVHVVQDQIASDTREIEEDDEVEETRDKEEDVDNKSTTRTSATTTSGDVINIKDQSSGEIDNMNYMANRLHSLQQRGRSSIKKSFRRSSNNSNDNNNGGDDNEEQQTSGDRLIDALNSVDSGRGNKSFLSRMKKEYTELIVPKYPKFRKNISNTLLFIILPCLSISSILFYMFDNPLAGTTGTSISWWILFLGVRQPLMFELTRVGEVFWVEIFALRSKLFNLAVGPYVSLAFIQSQGWPYIICFWAVLDFVFLYGSYEFPKHWLWWQNKIDLFNAKNPVVGVTDNETYMRLLISCIFVGVTSSMKRLFLAIYLGRRAVAHYGPELEALMAKMILIGEVANLARDIENKRDLFEGALSPIFERGDEDEKLVRFRELMYEENSSVEATPSPRGIQRKTLDMPKAPSSGGSNTPKPSPTEVSQGASSGRPPRSPRHSPPRPRGSSSDGTSAEGGDKKKFETSSTANVKLVYLLSEWEEPESAATKSRATVRDLVEFKKAVASMGDKYPLSHAFGNARTREECVQSSQEVYDRLMLSAGDCSALPFSVLSVLAMDEKGEFVDAKIKSLIRLFRPDRQGNLIRLDFVKSVDAVYKQLRLLRASIANSAQIDYAFERIFNLFFYFFLVVIAVAILGINIWTVFLSFNTFFLGFSFLFGSAASNYFEGLLLIFVRRPYDIGDRIATSNPKSDTNSNGSSTWYVDRVTLFTTTVRFATTNEVATYSNGSLALLRIINANRSPKAIISVLIKFGLETPFSKITVFRTAVENFIKARPREWITISGFRATRVEADFGYIEYKIVVQHRESWQNIGPVLQSKADLSSFCLEATKKLDMKYESPPMPVNLSTSGNLDVSGIFEDEDGEPRGNIGGDRVAPKSLSAEDLQEVANLFEIRKKKR